jgi:hypothetical protein
MALNDWKKDSMYEDGYGFKKDEGNSFKILMITTEPQDNNIHHVDAWKTNPFKSLTRRKFKNYKSALAFAKSYMKTH